MAQLPSEKMPSVAQLRAGVSSAARKHLDWIWQHFLANREWPTDRRIYRDTLKPDFERVLETLNGSYIQEVEYQGMKTYQVMPIGILSTSKGPDYEALLRKYVGHLREVYYNHDKQNSVAHAEVQRALALTGEQTVLVGRLLHAGLLSTSPGHSNDFSTWSTHLPSGLGDILPHQGSTEAAFDVLIRRHWFPKLKISAYERSREMFAMPAPFDFNLGFPVVAAERKKPLKREKITQSVAALVVTLSCRRCALCFGLNGDLAVKEGQIVHINRKASNSRPENLVWLCLPHHAQYDTVSNRNRGFIPEELRQHRTGLWAAIKRKEHHATNGAKSVPEAAPSPFEAAIKASPSDSVLQAWQMVERYAIGALQTKMAIPNPELMPGGVRSRMLRDFAGVDQKHADLHDQLGGLRNAVAHGAQIDEAGARAFCEKAGQLIAYLGQK